MGDSTSFSGGSPINARGPDVFICVRANGPKNASYGNNWWERGMDYGDEMVATLKDPSDITFTRTGINASDDQFPMVETRTLGTVPLAYNVLTEGNNHPISPYDKTPAVGINLIAPDRELFGAATVWRTLDGTAAAPDGSAAFTVSPRHPDVGDVVTIQGTTYYNGNYVVTGIAGDAFLASPVWIEETFAAATVDGVGDPTPLASVAPAADNSALFTATGHGLAVGEFVAIGGTANYNGLYVVTAVAGDDFQLAPRYTADRFAGATVVGTNGATNLESVADTAIQTTVFAAPGHALVVGEFVSVAGTSDHDGLYVVKETYPAVGTFQVSPRYVAETFVGANVTGEDHGTTPLQSVAANANDGSAVFASPGHQLVVGENVVITGTSAYDGAYVVTNVDGPTFQVAPRHVPETFGNVNGVLLTGINLGTPGKAIFKAPGHGLAVGDAAVIGGTTKYAGNNQYYTGSYVVTAVNGDDFEVAPPCTPTPLAGAMLNDVIPLLSVAAATDGSASFTATLHGLAVGSPAVITNAGHYNGTYVVSAVPDADTLQVVRAHVPQTFAAARINTFTPLQSVASAPNGHAVFNAVSHGLGEGDVATITGAGSYNGSYIAVSVTTNTFEAAPRYIPELFATVTGTVTVPLLSVTAAGDGRAVFTAPSHGLAVDSPVTISGTGTYDGTFVVTQRTASTFQVAPQGATADYADAWAGTTLARVESYPVGNTATFEAPDRTFDVGEKIAISDTLNYDGVYAVTNVSDNTFRVGLFYEEEEFPTVNATVAVTSVASYDGGYAIFTAAGHGLEAGDAAVIAGTDEYDGNYVALAVAGGSFTVAPRFQAETPAGAAVGRKIASVVDDSSVLPHVAAIVVPGSAYSDGDRVVIGGSTNYDGAFIARSPAGEAFALSPAYVAGAMPAAARANGTIVLTASSDMGDGSALFTANGHGLTPGDEAEITGAPNYNGRYVVMAADTNTFAVVRRYVAEEFTTAVAGKALTKIEAAAAGGSALFTAAGHGFSLRDPVWIGGTVNYDGHYLISNAASADTFQVAVSFVGAETNNANVNGKLLVAVADAGDNSALFTSPNHGFAIGAAVVVAGTDNYDGSYAVTEVAGNSFRLGPRYIPEIFADAQVATPLTRVMTWPANPLLATFTAPEHGLEEGDFVRFAGTPDYDRDYVVTVVETDNDLQVSPRWLGDLAAGATVNGITIKSVEDAGDGSVGIRTFAAHGIAVDAFATIQGTDNYDGEYVVTVAAGDYLEVVRRCVTVVSGYLNGTALTAITASADGRAWFMAPGHGITTNRLATVTGTGTYDGLYIVTTINGSAVQLSPRYYVEAFAGATLTWSNGSSTIESVANSPADGSAIFAARNLTFVAGEIVNITGTPTYNGVYAVTETNVDGVVGTFRVTPRYVPVELANVDGTPLESVSDLGGFTLFTAPGHRLSDGDFTTIGGTVYYDGYYLVTDVDIDTFQVRRACEADDFVGATVNFSRPLLRAIDFGDGSAAFVAPSHHLMVGYPAYIEGTGRYDGYHIVTDIVDSDTFQVGPRCAPEYLPNAGISQVLIASVADAGDRTALFTSPAHGLSDGDFVTIQGTGTYDGYHVVINATANTFQIVPRCLASAEIFGGSTTLNGMPFTEVHQDTDGGALFYVTGHGLRTGSIATVAGAGRYDGDYIVIGFTTDTLRLCPMVAPQGRLQSLSFEIWDTGTANFDISDLIDPTIQHPTENQEGRGCGIALYVDNPIRGQQGVYDEHDIRMPMSKVPYIMGPPQLPCSSVSNSSPNASSRIQATSSWAPPETRISPPEPSPRQGASLSASPPSRPSTPSSRTATPPAPSTPPPTPCGSTPTTPAPTKPAS